MKKIVSQTYYSGDMCGGSVIFNKADQEKNWEWSPVTLGSIGQGLWKIACGNK